MYFDFSCCVLLHFLSYSHSYVLFICLCLYFSLLSVVLLVFISVVCCYVIEYDILFHHLFWLWSVHFCFLCFLYCFVLLDSLMIFTQMFYEWRMNSIFQLVKTILGRKICKYIYKYSLSNIFFQLIDDLYHKTHL